MPHWKVKSGFTLVELLVVLGLLSATVASTLIFLTSTLKGSNQAAVTGELKQNGQIILDQLERQIRGASSAQIIDGHLKLTTASSGVFHIRCFPTGATNGWIGTSSDSRDDPPLVSYTPLTNRDDPISGINVSVCSLTAQAASTGGLSPGVVSISFTLTNGVGANALRPDLKGSAAFQTTISLRQAQ